MSAIRRAVDQTQYDKADVGYTIFNGAIMLFMVPGLMFLYAGLVRRKNALSLIWACFFANSVATATWYLWGYSLAFSSTATNGFIGNLDFIVHHNVLGAPSTGSPLIPSLAYSFFQLEACCVTVAIIIGAVAERGRLMPSMVFIFVWVTLVYAPVACWAWNPNGWAFKFGVLDFAGGGPVEIGSGVGGLAYSWVLGRRNERETANFRSYSPVLISLGTFILWFGWIGFNAGSAFGANLRAVYAALNTCISAAVAGIVWVLLDYRIGQKFTMIGLCAGTIAGLIGATASSGYIPLYASFILGIVSAVACNYGTKIKGLLKIDDPLDIFAQHGLIGIVGLLFNGFFATTQVISLDNVNTSTLGGFVDGNYKQLFVQVVYICACSGYVFTVTAVLAKIFCLIPILNLRASDNAESIGIDKDQIGEFVEDFTEVRRAFVKSSLPTTSNEKKLSGTTRHHNHTIKIVASDRHGVYQPDFQFSHPYALKSKSEGPHSFFP